jgi:hypothetical protein
VKKGVCLLLAATLSACGGGAVPPTVAPDATTTPPSGTAVEIEVAPEFIQGTIPGAPLMLLLTLVGGEEATLSVTGDGAEVTVAPERIGAGQVAEVTVVASPTDEEIEAGVTIVATADGGSSQVTRTFTVLPWPDDRGEQAREILALFAGWLGENRPELGIAEEIAVAGSFTAPLLLVVSHYTFWTDEWEMGLSWHVMVPPDDFAELYLRPREELTPTMAFRLGSWQTALETGAVDITEVPPPPEVVR